MFGNVGNALSITTCKQISLGRAPQILCQFAVSSLDSLVCLCSEAEAKMSASATSTAINVKNSGKSQLSRFCSEKQLIPKESKLPLFMYMMVCTYIYNIYIYITPKYLSPGKHGSSCWCSLQHQKDSISSRAAT